MIGAWNRTRVQAGQELVLSFDTDRENATWALSAANGVSWMSFADSSSGVCRGTAVAGEGGLLIVESTADGETETAAVVVEVIAAGFQVAYETAFAQEGHEYLALPETWLPVAPVKYVLLSAPPGTSIDNRTGAVRGSMPPGGGVVGVAALDARGDIATASLRLVSRSADSFTAFVEDSRTRTGGDVEIGFVAGELVDKVIETPGAVPPLSASLVASPPWASLSDGDEVRLGGTTTPGGDGLLDISIEDSTGATGRFRAWANVGLAIPFQLQVPERITGEAGDIYPGELFARILGGRAPYVLAVELAPSGVAINSITRQITGMFPDDPGVVPIRFSATDANNLKVFATMEVESLNPTYAILQGPISVAAGGQVNEQPTVTGGTAARWWAKQGGPPWLSVNDGTGLITGTAPQGAETAELTLFSISTLGVRATLNVRIEVTQGATRCSIPAVSAVRGTSGQRQITVTGAPGGWTTAKISGPAWLSVSSGGVVSWGSLGSTDTDVAPLVVEATRTADGVTSRCTITPTISDAPTTVSCSISGPSTLAPGASAIYTVSAPGASAWTLDATTGVFTITALGGGRFRVTANTGFALGGSYSFSGGVTVGSLSGSCSHSVDYEYLLTCSVPSISIEEGSDISSGINTSESGRPNSTFALSSTDLPTGVTMTNRGIFGGGSGLAVGSHDFTVTVTESPSGRTSTCSGTITVTSVVPPAETPSCSVPTISFQEGSPGSYSMSGSGGTSPYTYAASGLPSGASLSSSGSFSGLSGLAVGSYNFTVTITDANNQTGTCSGTITVTAVPVTPSCSATPALSGIVGQTFSVQLPAPTNISGTLTYSRASGPTWISISASGLATGTFPASPTTGKWSYSVSGVGGSCTGAEGDISVTNPALACSAGSTTGFQREALSTSVSASGASGNYTYALDSSSHADISLSGTTVTLSAQTADGTFTYRINVTDSDGSTAHCSGTLTVSGRRLDLVVGGDTTVVAGEEASGTLEGIGGTTPYRSIFSGTSGVTVEGTGANRTWKYTPAAGTSVNTLINLRFSIIDATGARVNKVHQLRTAYPPLRLTGPTTIFPVRDRSTGFQWVASGGSGRDNYTFSYTITPDPEGIPSGLTHFHNIVQFRTSANIIFEPETDGNGLFSITVTDNVTGLKATVNGTYEAVDQFIVRRIGGVSLGPGATVNLSIVFSGGLHPYEIAGGSETYTHPETGLRTTVSWPKTSISSGTDLDLPVSRDNRVVFDEPLLVTTALEARDASNQRLQIGLPITLAVEN